MEGVNAKMAPLSIEAAEARELLRRTYVAAIRRAEAGQHVCPRYLSQARAFVACTMPLPWPMGWRP